MTDCPDFPPGTTLRHHVDGSHSVVSALPSVGQAMREQRLAVIEAVRAFVADDPMGGDRQRTLDFLDNLRHWEERAEADLAVNKASSEPSEPTPEPSTDPDRA